MKQKKMTFIQGIANYNIKNNLFFISSKNLKQKLLKFMPLQPH